MFQWDGLYMGFWTGLISCSGSRSLFLLSKRLEAQAELLGFGRQRWCVERIVDPFPQIAVGEEVPPKKGYQVRERPVETGAELEVFQEQHGDQGRPDLDLQGIGARPNEGLDLQVLLQGLEEQLNLPAVLVDAGDGTGGEVHMVGQENQKLTTFRVPIGDPTQQAGAVLPGFRAGKPDELVTQNATVPGSLPAFDDFVGGIGTSAVSRSTRLARTSLRTGHSR